MDQIFRDRYSAGRQLAAALPAYCNRRDVLVLALPRGGVPVAYEIARALNATLDILVVRRLGVPQQPELAMGTITSGGASLFNDALISLYGLTPRQIESVVRCEQIELEWRERQYRGNRRPLHLAGRTVIVVDDGVATGATMLVAVKALRALHPAAIVMAVPVGPWESVRELEFLTDDCVCLSTPAGFHAVSQWYYDFTQVTDEEVYELLLTTQSGGSVYREKAEASPTLGDRGGIQSCRL
ncbi:MAG TPA: phosphoribosyltransferase [Gammaproteobacteria bacterium]